VILHAGLIARFDAPWWRGVLIEGSSGAGKSDLALRLLGQGWALVADDRCEVWISNGRVFGRAAEPLKGRIEVRGLGVEPVVVRDFAPIALVARCVAPAEVERLPDDETVNLLGQPLPVLKIAALQASAPMKLAYALSRLGLGR
jgi:serine kinase of HPr protein (carbohydrate metabolism regulator)